MIKSEVFYCFNIGYIWFYLDSKVPPQVTQGPASKMLLPDKNEILTCKVEGSVGTTITWYKDDQPLTADEYFEPNGATLTLKNTYYKTHDGSYYCKANNTYGESTSRSGIIRIYCN